MGYMRVGGLEEAESLGCGPGCRCAPCRLQGLGLAETYVREEEDEEPDPPAAAAARSPGPASTADVAGWAGGFAASIEARDPRTGVRCEASERRIRPVVEPPGSELVEVDPRYLVDRAKRVPLHRTAYEAYQRLKAEAEAAGIPAGLLRIVSGYRSVEHQRRLWEGAKVKYGSEEVARRWVAPPGGSPHHTGRAIDFYLGTRNDSSNIAALRATPAYGWMVCNASRFGFFPYAREPWHWEFNPGNGAPPPAPRALPPTGVPPGRPAPAGAAPSLGLTGLTAAVAQNTVFGITLGWNVLYPAIASWILRLRDGATPVDFARAVAAWQGRVGLPANGILDDKTWRTMLRGAKAGIPTPFVTPEGVRRPHGLQQVVETFGDPTRPGWEAQSLVQISAPPGRQFAPRRDSTRVHRLLAPQFNRLFAAIERAGLWGDMFPSAGTYACRTKKAHGKKPCGTPGVVFNQLSTHSWGITIDFRSEEYRFYTAGIKARGEPLRMPPPRITRIFQDHGFHYGLWFMRDQNRVQGRIDFVGADPMHFQFATGF